MRVAAFVVLILVAGCSDNPPAPAQDDDFGGLEGKVTATTGLIRGVVVDASIVPIADARISIASITAATTSNADGLFLLDGLDEGIYDMEISKPGYTTVRQQAQVVAGVDRPEAVKVQLLQDAAGVPFFVPDTWAGYMTCSTSVIQVCAIPNSFLPIFCEADITCLLPQSVTDDNFLRQVEVLRQPTWIQSELTWRSTQQLGDTLSYIMESPYRETDLDTTFEEYGRTTGSSPLVLWADAVAINATHLGLPHDFYGATNGLVPLQLRVFSGPSETLGGTAGAVVEQHWEAFSHVFYGYAPPEGWRFTQQPEVPGP